MTTHLRIYNANMYYIKHTYIICLDQTTDEIYGKSRNTTDYLNGCVPAFFRQVYNSIHIFRYNPLHTFDILQFLFHQQFLLVCFDKYQKSGYQSK